ncbi:MAG: filamentous hemagglutinin N-terminal domain-containing protein, partial [Desulfatitalea sp.]|nr:filamentous hemagglutinin N-terminal domain-containing protein [Desulfatitalea sp.]
MRKQLLILFLVLDVTFFPAMAMAEANIPGFYGNTGNLVQPSANQLPVYQTIGTGISNIQTIGSNQMVVYQDESKAIQDWDTFDIGADASVHFDQQGNTSWAALNRIYDDNPSQIFGRLSADGKIYLINPNGMLFGESAQVNVHTIAASALEMTGFDSNEMLFAAGDEQITDDWLSDTWVVNKGSITTESGGAVFLLAPNVANEGTIEAPDGMINMAAGTYAHYWETLGDGGITITPYFSVQMTGETVNTETGHIQADGGDIRLFGQVVNTDGLIRSVQAVNNQGTIELRATQKVHVGETGQIETPIDTSSETFHSSYTLIPGKVTLAIGNDPVWKNEVSDPEVFADRQILLEGDIIAPAGEVYLIFEDTNSDHDRIYLGESSSIDVSGLWVEKSAEDQLVETQLNSVELRDDYGQKDGDLQGETITYLQNDGTAIGTVGAHLDAIEATNAEKAAAGGTVTMDLRNESGDIVI